jgi:hypothetical protein
MTSVTQVVPSDPVIRAAGSFAIISGIVSTIGVILLIAMFVCFATPYRELGMTFGMLNDICVAIQYLLTIPIALALHRILLPHNPTLIRIATLVGIVMMMIVIVLQLLLVFDVLPFEKQVLWVSLAMIVGVGSWLIITGMVARSTGILPNSILMSTIAVPYLGYPAWAFWLGRRLLSW